MIIRQMHATFGRLSGETLDCKEGLNVITLPNEAGKTTWSEFLLAMLYGVDTRERSRQGYLAVKEKYRPWQGGLMQGSLTLEYEGKTITLERSGSERAPMAQLRAYETASGLPYSLPEGEGCGMALVHAERSVYERSGFLRQQQHALTQDPALSSRLAALVTTGDERYAYPALEKALRDLRNACRANRRNGLIPETEASLEKIRVQLAELETAQRQLAQAETELPEAERALAYWQEQELLCSHFETAQSRRRLEQAEQALEGERQQLESLTARCAELPDAQALTQLRARIDETASELSRAQSERASIPQPEAPPAMPPALRGLDAAAAEARAAEDRKKLSALRQLQPRRKHLPLYPALIALLLGAGALAAGLLIPMTALTAVGAGLLLCAAGAWLWNLRSKRAWNEACAHTERQAQQLADAYGATPETLEAAAAQRIAELRDYAARDQARKARQAQAEAALSDWEKQLDALLDETDRFGPRASDLNAARTVVSNALSAWDALDRQREQVRIAERHAEDLRSVLGDALPAQPIPEGATPPDPQQVQLGLAQARARVQAARSSIDRLNGRLGAGEDAMTLEALRERQEARLAELERKLSALELASRVLSEANDELQARFSPLVCSRASELFSLLTEGRYERLTLDAGLNVTVWERGAAVGHSLEWLSAGTADQLYLALRLAISELLLPDAPLILDDALVAFDDERAAAALRVLSQCAKERQILLFTCQSREQRLLAEAV